MSKEFTNEPKVYQFHWQSMSDNKSVEFVSQKEISTKEEMTAWINEITCNNQQPPNTRPLICWEGSEYFVGTSKEENNKKEIIK